MPDDAPRPGPVPRAVVLAGVAAAGTLSWVIAVVAAVTGWRAAFVGGSRHEDAAGFYLMLSLLAAALFALPATFLQWLDPDHRDRWRRVGVAVGVSACVVFALAWWLH